MELEVGQIWVDKTDDHLEIVVKINKEEGRVHVLAYDGVSVTPLTLEFSHDPLEAMLTEDSAMVPMLTLKELTEIYLDERRKEVH